MKHTAVIVALLFFAIHGYSQSAKYYWSGGRKIYLVPDSTNWVLLPVKGYSKQLAASQMKSDVMFSNVKSSAGSELIDFTLKEHSKGLVEKLKLKFSRHGEITCQHLVEGKIPITLTSEILLQPKKSVTIERILELVGHTAKLTHRTEYNTFVLTALKIEDALTIANQIYESGLVDWCHPDFWAEIKRTTTDPLYNQQYYLNQSNNFDINAPEAFAITQGCDVRVAVIDDGVENHEDLNGRVLQGFTARNATGFGAPVANLPPANLMTIGHGQACAGIIGATQNNNLGIGGIAPNCRIVPVNIFSDWFVVTDPNGNQFVRFRETPQDLAASINWAWNPLQGNAHVISNSWGFGSTSGPGGVDADAIRQAITNARTQGRGNLGCIVVFASGNSNIRTGCSAANGCFNGVSFPGNVDGVITVGAMNRNGAIWDYSSRGAEMDLVAPSGNVNLQGDISTTDRMGNNGYEAGNNTNRFGGTSAACPQVSGVAALMLSVNPNLTETQARTILQQTATDMGTSGFDNTFGFGRLNAEAALKRVLSDMSISIVDTNPICASQTFTLQNQPAGTTLTWLSGNPSGLTINATTGAATRVNNFSGLVTVTATLTNNTGCTTSITKTVKVGNYTPSGMSSYASNCSYGTFNLLNTSLSAMCTANSTISFTYRISDPNYSNFVFTPVSVPSGASWTSSGGNLYVSVSAPPTQGARTATIALTATGPCGPYTVNFSSTAVNVYSSGFSLSSNPSRDNVTVSANNARTENENGVSIGTQNVNEPSENLLYAIKIDDSLGGFGESFEYKSGVKSVNLSLQHYKPGLYIVSVYDGKTWSQERLIVQK